MFPLPGDPSETKFELSWNRTWRIAPSVLSIPTEGFNMIQLTPNAKRLAQQETDFTCDVNSEPVARAPLADPETDIAVEDFDILLNAVKARLRQSAGECATATTDSQTRDTALRVQASVLECVVALDQLHAMLTKELHRSLPMAQ
ncbi:MAG: hypothetical protein ABI606_15735 [Rhodoferax sp.]